VYVKDEGSNLNTDYNPKISCKLWCVGFGKTFFKQLVLVMHLKRKCQYATKNEKVCKSLKYVFVKVVQLDL
jgi:hypothetical protein